ncbi:hypothetical protein [Salinactinospora qingdaonensis]|uniref:Uncharacterized protein n=1 Tax=Salinactinospora qingdaonensis TaxID=702744 RepID=A0ABP7GAZ9_9ACTN
MRPSPAGSTRPRRELNQLGGAGRLGIEKALEREIPDHESTVGGEEARRRVRRLHGERLGRYTTEHPPVQDGQRT